MDFQWEGGAAEEQRSAVHSRSRGGSTRRQLRIGAGVQRALGPVGVGEGQSSNHLVWRARDGTRVRTPVEAGPREAAADQRIRRG